MVKKRLAIICGHIERQALSETWRAVTVLVCFRNEGFHACGTLSSTTMMVLGKLRWMVTPRGRFSSVQLLSHVQLFATPWTAARQASLSITNSWSLLKLMSIELVMPPNHLILSSHSPPTFNLSQHQGLFK